MASYAENVSIWWRHHVLLTNESSGLHRSPLVFLVIFNNCEHEIVFKPRNHIYCCRYFNYEVYLEHFKTELVLIRLTYNCVRKMSSLNSTVKQAGIYPTNGKGRKNGIHWVWLLIEIIISQYMQYIMHLVLACYLIRDKSYSSFFVCISKPYCIFFRMPSQQFRAKLQWLKLQWSKLSLISNEITMVDIIQLISANQNPNFEQCA